MIDAIRPLLTMNSVSRGEIDLAGKEKRYLQLDRTIQHARSRSHQNQIISTPNQTPTMMLLPPPTKQHRLRWLIVVSVSALISVRMAAAFTSVASRQCVISRYQPSSRKYAAEPEQPSSKSTTSTLALSASLIDDAKLLIENSM